MCIKCDCFISSSIYEKYASNWLHAIIYVFSFIQVAILLADGGISVKWVLISSQHSKAMDGMVGEWVVSEVGGFEGGKPPHKTL